MVLHPSFAAMWPGWFASSPVPQARMHHDALQIGLRGLSLIAPGSCRVVNRHIPGKMAVCDSQR